MSGSKKVFTTLGSSNHVPEEREAFDYYATDPRAVEMLLELEQFSPVIWEPACGEGHISKVLQAHGYEVISTDLIYRGFGDPEPLDFLKETLDDFEGDIITNPPYSMGLEFVQRALESVRPGGKVAMFLKVQFLEGQKRGEFFMHTPPRKVYISRSRLACYKNGVSSSGIPPRKVYISRSRLACYKNGDMTGKPESAIAYAWYVWEKGFTGDPVIKWFN